MEIYNYLILVGIYSDTKLIIQSSEICNTAQKVLWATNFNSAV